MARSSANLLVVGSLREFLVSPTPTSHPEQHFCCDVVVVVAVAAVVAAVVGGSFFFIYCM